MNKFQGPEPRMDDEKTYKYTEEGINLINDALLYSLTINSRILEEIFDNEGSGPSWETAYCAYEGIRKILPALSYIHRF